jgi:hypothetical protein
VNVALAPTHAVCGEGWPVTPVTPGTTSDWALLVTLPHALLTTQSYDPASPADTDAIVYVLDVAPEMFAVFFRHWYIGLVPNAVTENVAGDPAQMFCVPVFPDTVGEEHPFPPL